MLTPDDKIAIDGLFGRLAEVERNAPPRDAEAERLIAQKIAQQPSAPYYLAQTVVVQEQALEQAQQRIAELERQGQRRGGLFGGLFGDGAEEQPRTPQRRRYRDDRGPWQQQQGYGGGGFLAGAAQTALGVTSGVLLGSAIAGMFGTSSAEAAEQPAGDQNADANDAGDTGDFGGDDFGGDGGDFGDFGGGGDF